MDKTIKRVNEKSYGTFLRKLPLALVGVILVGFGLAFNSAANLGNDTVAVLYDGVRNALGFPIEKLGLVTNMVNLIFVAAVFIFGRHYINIGTFIYALSLGYFVDIGFKLHGILNIPAVLGGRIFSSFIGCSMVFIGIGIYIAMDIGMDPVTGMNMLVRDLIKRQFKTAKITSDVSCLVIGYVLGGKAGVVTVIAAFTGGPIIQKVSETFDKQVLRKVNLSRKAA
jgi:uncharacterized membrane protein YczE